MALTRDALLSRPACRGPLFIRALRILYCIAPALFSACAEAPDGSEWINYVAVDASDAARQDSAVISETEDAGTPPAQNPPSVMEAGTARDAAPPRDSATPPMDSSTPTPVRDTGAQTPTDTGVDARPPQPVDAAPDTATPPPRDAATNPAMCAVAPSYPTTTACGTCTCMKCPSQITACVASSDSTKNSQCAAVRACAEQNRCMGQECYCGSSPLCLNPDGPCRSQIEAAVGSSELSAITAARDDPNSPLGRSIVVGTCQQMNCRSECGL